MKKFNWVLPLIIFLYFIMPFTVSAYSIKTISGTVSIYGSQIMLSTASAAKYAAEVGAAQLTRKNGVAMQFKEILVGDKVQVTGILYQDNSIRVTSLKDNSLYTHTGTFTGKITGINPSDSSFTMQSKSNGEQTIYTNNFTSYSKNGSSSGFQNLELGMTATVKGVWDRDNTNITATSVAGNFRLIAIYFTGYLSMKGENSLTVVGNGNVIYGVDITHATILNKAGKPVPLSAYNLSDTLRVWGKHISGMWAVTATQVKDTNLTK